MDILILLFALELSGLAGKHVQYEPSGFINEDLYNVSTFLTFSVEALIYKHVFIRGYMKVLMYPLKDTLQFWPTALSSFFTAGVVFNGVEIGWRHICTHPIVPYIGKNPIDLYSDQGANELYIRYETKSIKIF